MTERVFASSDPVRHHDRSAPEHHYGDESSYHRYAHRAADQGGFRVSGGSHAR